METPFVPSVFTTFASEIANKKVRFYRPSLAAGTLEELHESKSGASPRSVLMAVRRFKISVGEAIIWHRHLNQQKVYVMDDSGLTVLVLIYESDPETGKPVMNYFHLLKQGQTLVIPPERWHCVYCPLTCPLTGVQASNGKPANITAIISSKSAGDIFWCDDAEKALSNEHLQVA